MGSGGHRTPPRWLCSLLPGPIRRLGRATSPQGSGGLQLLSKSLGVMCSVAAGNRRQEHVPILEACSQKLSGPAVPSQLTLLQKSAPNQLWAARESDPLAARIALDGVSIPLQAAWGWAPCKGKNNKSKQICCLFFPGRGMGEGRSCFNSRSKLPLLFPALQGQPS